MLKYKPLFLHKNYDEYFFNRKEDIKQIKYQIEAVKQSLPQQLLLVGYRGVGKTYLLKKIIDESDSCIICSYTDIMQLYSLKKDNLTIEDVLIELLDCMNKSITDKNYKTSLKDKVVRLIDNLKNKNFDFNECSDLFNIPIPKIEENYTKLARFVMEFPQHIVDEINNIKGFVIIIDEFQMLNEIKEMDEFFALIRSFTQTQHNVSYVFTGLISRSSEIIYSINGDKSAFGNRLQQITIEPFTKEETRTYFNECMSEIQFSEDGFDRFYKCTMGIPLYINSFYNIMDSSELYDEKLVKDTFFSNVDQILVNWAKIWAGLHDSEKNILKILIDEDYLTWSEILDKSEFSRGTFNKYLFKLIHKGIVSYSNNKYFIEDKMLRIWLKHQKEVFGFYP